MSTLLNQGVAIDQRDASGHTALHHASSNGHDEAVAILLSRADPNAATEDGLTALHLAAKRGLDSIVAALLAHKTTKADPVNNQDETPLHFASYCNRPGCVRGLIGGAADVNRTNKLGEYPQHLSAYHGHAECMAALVASEKFEPDARNAWGETALHLAGLTLWRWLLLEVSRLTFPVFRYPGLINDAAFICTR